MHAGELWSPTLTGDLKSRLTSEMYIVKVCSPAESVKEESHQLFSTAQTLRANPRALSGLLCLNQFISWHRELKGRLLFKSLLFTPDYERDQQLSNDFQGGMLCYMLKYTSQISKQQQCSLEF